MSFRATDLPKCYVPFVRHTNASPSIAEREGTERHVTPEPGPQAGADRAVGTGGSTVFASFHPNSFAHHRRQGPRACGVACPEQRLPS